MILFMGKTNWNNYYEWQTDDLNLKKNNLCKSPKDRKIKLLSMKIKESIYTDIYDIVQQSRWFF